MPTPKPPSGPWVTLLRVAWLAIVLGLLLQLAVLLVAAGFGKDISPRPVLAETLKTVSWSLLVCVGVALGRVAAKGRLPLEGVTGLLAAPLALTAANAVQKGVAEAVDAAGVSAGPVPVWVLAIKAAEYGCLGLALEWVGRQAWGSALGHLAVGLLTGVVFGGLFLTVVVQTAPTPLPTPALLAKGLNELLFPVGCALVVFIAEVLRTHLDPATAADPLLTTSPAVAGEPTSSSEPASMGIERPHPPPTGTWTIDPADSSVRRARHAAAEGTDGPSPQASPSSSGREDQRGARHDQDPPPSPARRRPEHRTAGRRSQQGPSRVRLH